MSDIAAARRALVARILDGEGRAAGAQRHAAFANAGLDGPLGALVAKLTRRAAEVSDADVAAVRAAGLDEDQVFELAICAAIGQAERHYQRALAALDEAAEEERDAPRHPR